MFVIVQTNFDGRVLDVFGVFQDRASANLIRMELQKVAPGNRYTINEIHQSTAFSEPHEVLEETFKRGLIRGRGSR